MEIPFAIRGVAGRVVVSYERNRQPESVGCRPETRGFPVCSAAVERPLRGYDSLMGWVQLVRSDDNESGGGQFEMDPLAFVGPLPHPFCWLGLNPTLFDVPSRSTRADLDWTARSFLCVPDDLGNGLEAYAVLGFEWGFAIHDGEITLDPPRRVDAQAWDEILPVLRAEHAGWGFPAGFTELS
jgi:hypothetical protein